MKERQRLFLDEFLDKSENGCLDKEEWIHRTRFGEFVSYKKIPVCVKCFDATKEDLSKAPNNVQNYLRKNPKVEKVLYFVGKNGEGGN